MDWCHLNQLCGGCTYGGYEYEEQRNIKNQQLLDLYRPILDDDSVWEGTFASPLPSGYKNKMEYSFGDEVKNGPLTLGMHKKKSFYTVLTCDDCKLCHEDYNRIVRRTVDFFNEKGVSYLHKRSHQGYLRHLVLRRSFATGEILCDLVTTTGAPYIEEWKNALLGLELDGSIAGVLHTINNSKADAVIDEGTEVLWGRDYITEKLLGLEFKITPFSFFQTNSLGAEVLYQKVREYVGDTRGKIVYDLYSGTGTIAQLVAAVAKGVYGVEIVEEAVAAAKENAVLNGLSNCQFIAGDVLKVIGDLQEKPDLIILDPPRPGLHPKVLPIIAGYGVDQIIYVACKPESFVRDYEYFHHCGYHIEKACGCDMFPYTKHVETVVLLCKK